MTGQMPPAVPGTAFLPVNRAEMEARGWGELDFLLVNGDAYVDHPSFGGAVIARVLEARGFRVGILSQPDWKDIKSYEVMGRPRLAVLVTSGNLDSMLNRFTAAKKSRSGDSYSPGGERGFRPDRAVIVYCNGVRELWGDVPLIIGGVEASLRRFAHYDYWSDRLRRSILIDSGADLLVYGMGEKQAEEVAGLLDRGVPVKNIRSVRGTMYKTPNLPGNPETVVLPSWEEVVADKTKFARAFRLQYDEQDPFHGRPVAQKSGGMWAVQNPSPLPLSQEEMDRFYRFPYTRTCHPMYEKSGGVPAIEEVRFSLTSHRGCFGSCSFCAIHYHQGRIIQSRSHESLLEEARLLISLPDFKGYIHDVGGPTANFRIPSCGEQLTRGACRGKQCLHPSPCSKLKADHSDYIALLRKLRALPGVKKVFIRSGIRFDYLLEDKKTPFLKELCEHHISGQLKIAPEHVSPRVLSVMGKSRPEVYVKFTEAYASMNKKLGRKQFLVPYFISSHPGSDLSDAVRLAEFLRDSRCRPEQVQDFIPTPGSLSTCIYYTGIDPFSGEAVYVPKSTKERKMQRALLQYGAPKNRATAARALVAAGRRDLIGDGPLCLVRDFAEGQGKKRSGEAGGPAASRPHGEARSSPPQAVGRKGSSQGKNRSRSGGRRGG